MKTKLSFLLFAFIFSFIFINSCNKDGTKSEPKLLDYYLIDVSQEEGGWDYWVLDKEGHYILIQEENGLPSVIFVKPDDNHEGYPIYLDENGYPDKLIVEDYIFTFDNFNGYYLDIAIINPSGDVEVFREIKTETNWDTYNTKGSLETEAWSDVIRIAGHVAGGVSCGASLGAIFFTAGGSIPLAALSCTGFAAGLAAEFWPEDHELMGLAAAEVGAIATVLGCWNPTDLAGKIGCYSGIASGGLTITSWGFEAFENRADDVRMAEAALEGGYGDIQITLTWDNECDLDLHVIDPFEEEIFWNHKYSFSGGYLDFDDTDGYGPENVFWEYGSAPNGIYRVNVHNYYWSTGIRPSTSTFKVLVNAFGFVKTFSGSVTVNETVHVASFNQSGFVSTNKGDILINTQGQSGK